MSNTTDSLNVVQTEIVEMIEKVGAAKEKEIMEV